MKAKRVLAEALLLPREERLSLAKRLLVSLEEANSDADGNREKLWAEEIERRIHANQEKSQQVSKKTMLSNLSAVVRGEPTYKYS